MTGERSPAAHLGRWGSAAATVLAVLGVVLVLSACGSSSSTTSASGGSAGASNQSSSQTSNRLKFTQCMRQHGVNISDSSTGGPPPSNVPQSQLTAAGKACSKYGGGGFGNFSPTQRTAFESALLKYAACLRSKGINVPDPTFSSSGGPPNNAFRTALTTAQKSPGFSSANTACQSNLPSAMRGIGSGSGSSNGSAG